MRGGRAALGLALAAVLGAVVAVTVAVTGPPSRVGAQGTPDPPRLRRPVPGPIVEHFRAPPSPYTAGNRGVDFAPEPGTPVQAAAPGSVEFAGPVAGDLWVTVAHPGGHRTSYGPLAAVDVPLHQAVARGDPLGRSGSRLHLGLRWGDTYVDPEPWFELPRPGRAVLVPLDP